MSNTDLLPNPVRLDACRGRRGRPGAVYADNVDLEAHEAAELAAFLRGLGWNDVETLTVCRHCGLDETEVTFDYDYDAIDCDDCLAERAAEDAAAATYEYDR
jgi:hypothetical protein